MTVTASAFKRLFVGKDAKYAVLGEDADLVRVSGESGDILTVGESVFGEGDYVEIAGALRMRGPHTFDVKAYGAKGDGVTNDAAAINLAATAAGAATNGGIVYFPPGTYYVAGNTGGLLRPKSRTVWTGAGRGLSVILYDDTASGTDCIGNNIAYGSTYDALSNWTMRDLTMRGYAATHRTLAGQLLRVRGDDILIENCTFEYSRNMGLVLTGCRNAVVRGCRVFRSIVDGIAVWDSSDVLIEGNDCIQCNDDAISAHSDDLSAAPVRSGVTIANNRITESQGIAVLGLKNVIITGNVLKRIMGTAIRCQAPDAGVQGQSPQFVAKITNNTITDVFRRPETNPRNATQFYIYLGGGTRRVGAGAVPPGEIDTATGNVVSMLGSSGTGTLYANETGSGGAAMPAARHIEISGNVLMRTLPAPTTISAWGYPDSASGLWVGNNGDGTGFYNGSISEAYMNTDGIHIEGSLWYARINRNDINTTGACGIKFLSTVAATNMDFRDVEIVGNNIISFTDAGIRLPNASVTFVIRIADNLFDGDPTISHSNRKTGPKDGTWLAYGAPFGVWMNASTGVTVESNRFRNVSAVIENGSGALFGLYRRNIVYADIAAMGFSTSNKGVGIGSRTGIENLNYYIHEDSNPFSATYGRQLSQNIYASNTMPSTGTYLPGHFVYNTNPVVAASKVVIGWMRLTLGSAHVLNTDWTAVYGTIS